MNDNIHYLAWEAWACNLWVIVTNPIGDCGVSHKPVSGQLPSGRPLMKVRPHPPSLSSIDPPLQPTVRIDGNLQQIVHLPSPELERWEGIQSENAL